MSQNDVDETGVVSISNDQLETEGKPLKLNEPFELLILSEAGKPIYTFTKRDDAVTLMPLCSALIDYAHKTQNETLQFIKTSDNLMIVFSTRSPLIIIVIHDSNSYVDHQILVDAVEAQVISILTAKSLKSVFEDRPTFDLKRLLYGSEKLIDATINLSAFPTKLRWPYTQAFLAVSSIHNLVPNQALGAAPSSGSQAKQAPNLVLPNRPHRILIPVVMMTPSARENIANIVNNVIASNSKSIIFSLLFRIGSDDPDEFDDSNSTETKEDNLDVSNEDTEETESQKTFRLVVVCNHHDRHKIKISDIHIIQALLTGSRAQLESVESLWMPICLPKFNKDAFLHSYISFTNNNNYCLIVLSIDRDEFSSCQKSRNLIEEKLGELIRDQNQKNKIYYSMTPLVHPVLLELQDKLANSTISDKELVEAQQKSQIYNSKDELFYARQLQFLWYQTKKQVLWWQRSAHKAPNSMIYYITSKMLQSSLKHLWLKLADHTIFLGWHVPAFQLYAQFDSTITTNEASEVIQRITSWIKKEEDNFSIKDYK